MIKETKKLKLIAVEEIEKKEIICNHCGNKCDEGTWGNFVHVKYSGGYGSKYPGDLATVEFEICEDCLKNFVDRFVVEPKYGRYSL